MALMNYLSLLGLMFTTKESIPSELKYYRKDKIGIKIEGSEVSNSSPMKDRAAYILTETHSLGSTFQESSI